MHLCIAHVLITLHWPYRACCFEYSSPSPQLSAWGGRKVAIMMGQGCNMTSVFFFQKMLILAYVNQNESMKQKLNRNRQDWLGWPLTIKDGVLYTWFVSQLTGIFQELFWQLGISARTKNIGHWREVVVGGGSAVAAWSFGSWLTHSW